MICFFVGDELKTHWKGYFSIVIALCLSLSLFGLTEAYTSHMNEVSREVMVDIFTGHGRLVTDDSNAWDGFYSFGEIQDAEGLASSLEEEGFGASVEACAFVLPMYGYDDGPPLELRGIHTNRGDIYKLEKYLIKGSYFNDGVKYTRENGYGSQFTTLIMPDRNRYKPYPAIISGARASSLGLGIGDTITAPSFTAVTPLLDKKDMMSMMKYLPSMVKALLSGTALNAQVEIIGIYETPTELPGVVTVFLPIESLKEINGWGDKEGTAIHLIFPEPDELTSIESDLESRTGLKVVTWRDGIRFIGGDIYEIMRSSMRAITLALMIIILISIFAWMNSIVAGKKREISMLRTYGLKRRDNLHIFLLIGIVIGLLAGAGALCMSTISMFLFSGTTIKLAGGLFAPKFSLDSSLSLKLLLEQALFPVLVCMLGVLIPSIRSSRVTPVEGLRDSKM